jgi:hypothetical protein
MSEGRLLAALAGFAVIATGAWWWFARRYGDIADRTNWFGREDDPRDGPPRLKPPDSPAV